MPSAEQGCAWTLPGNAVLLRLLAQEVRKVVPLPCQWAMLAVIQLRHVNCSLCTCICKSVMRDWCMCMPLLMLAMGHTAGSCTVAPPGSQSVQLSIRSRASRSRDLYDGYVHNLLHSQCPHIPQRLGQVRR